MIYKEHFLVVGISYRKANLKKILEFLEYDYEFGQYKENGYLEPKNSEYYTQKMSLEREPENEHDKNAIKVMVGNIHLGYVPKKLARKMAKLLDAGYNYISELELMDDANGNYDIGIVNVILYNSETLPDIPPKNIQNLNGETVPLKKSDLEPIKDEKFDVQQTLNKPSKLQVLKSVDEDTNGVLSNCGCTTLTLLLVFGGLAYFIFHIL